MTGSSLTQCGTAPQPVVTMADGCVRGWTLPLDVALKAASAAATAGPQALYATVAALDDAWVALDGIPSDVLGASSRRRLEELAAAVSGSRADHGPRLAVRLAERDLSALPPSLARHLSDLLAEAGIRLMVGGAGVGPDPVRPVFLDVGGLGVAAVGLHPSVTATVADPRVSRTVAQLGSRLAGLGIAGVVEGVTPATAVERLLRRGWALGQGPRFSATLRPAARSGDCGHAA